MNRMWGKGQIGTHEENQSGSGFYNTNSWSFHVTSVWRDGSNEEMRYYIDGNLAMQYSDFGIMTEDINSTMYFGYQHGRSGHQHIYKGFIHT